jgi:hypothetical protein
MQQTNPRKFPRPWRVEASAAEGFVIKDANGLALAYVNANTDIALHREYLMPAEALAVAKAISKPPDSRLGRAWRDFIR